MVLLQANGFEIVERDASIYFYDRRTRGAWIAIAVGGGVAGICVLNAIAQVLLAVTTGQGSAVAGAIIGTIAIVPALIAIAANRMRLRRERAPNTSLTPLAVLDRRTSMLLDGRGQPIAPLSQVSGGRAMLISSSAPSVQLRAGGRRMEVFRGGLFGGGVEEALQLLGRLGVRVG